MEFCPLAVGQFENLCGTEGILGGLVAPFLYLMASWQQVEISVDGQRVKAIAPVVVSASRSTDIPAFYAEWFFNRLRKGYSAWRNPFNGARTYVSYLNTRFIVFWSKNPRPLLPYLGLLKYLDINCYVHYTLNDYEQEGLEGGVPPLAQRVETFKRLVGAMGLGSVVWRFDPLLLTDSISVATLLEKVGRIGDALRGHTEKLVFSYADIAAYKKVRYNLAREGVAYREWREGDMESFAAGLSQMNRDRGWRYELATCSEKIDLSRYGITHNRCIDGDLIARIAWQDQALMEFMKVKILSLPATGNLQLPSGGIRLPNGQYFASAHKKDSGQRPLCGCMAAKDIGEYSTCPHACAYCYANSSPQKARANWARHQRNSNSDSITGLI